MEGDPVRGGWGGRGTLANTRRARTRIASSPTELRPDVTWAARAHSWGLPQLQNLMKTQNYPRARSIDLTRASYLPGRALDLYKRRLHSGFLMGPSKLGGGWQFCLRCIQARGLRGCASQQHETVLHACHECPEPGGAAEIMGSTYRCWRRATGEELVDAGATALFGDRRAGRPEEDEKQHRHLEQPWRVLHAAVALAMDTRRGGAPSSTCPSMQPPYSRCNLLSSVVTERTLGSVMLIHLPGLVFRWPS